MPSGRFDKLHGTRQHIERSKASQLHEADGRRGRLKVVHDRVARIL